MMTKETKWTCDRCGKIAFRGANNCGQDIIPENWVYTDYKKVENNKLIEYYHLCSTCKVDYEKKLF